MDAHGAGIVSYAAIIVAISTASLVLRFWSRRIHSEKLWWDDWAILVGWFFQLAPAVNVVIFEGLQVALKDDSVFEGDLPREPDQADLFYALSYVFFTLYGLSISFTKWAILLFYWRLFSAIRWMRWAIIAVAVAIGCWTLSAITTWLAQCTPISKAWDYNVPGTCIHFYLFALLITSITLLTDVIILVLPIPVILRLNTTIGKKISLLCAFGIGGFACVITAIRLYIVTEGGPTPKFASHKILAWTLAEVSVAVICANLPLVYSLALHFLPSSVKKVFRHGYSSRQRTTVDVPQQAQRSKSKSDRQLSLPLSVFRRDSHTSDDQLRMISGSPENSYIRPDDHRIYVSKDFDVRR
ncbi:hypothetical protein CAC42_5933 [Sphaceloma murrayae]|uniref:Rhodopsin domain-containing protein n=1 Tax=Sphaceloma murrayae TaxID=2082308 RepID=A0A2K1QZW9_9PEZI|nr:hypothetical protein CAC42_5933 [Sphaceloma murrayae]